MKQIVSDTEDVKVFDSMIARHLDNYVFFLK